MKDFRSVGDEFGELELVAETMPANDENGWQTDASLPFASNRAGSGLGLVLSGALVGTVGFAATLIIGGGFFVALLVYGLTGMVAMLLLATVICLADF